MNLVVQYVIVFAAVAVAAWAAWRTLTGRRVLKTGKKPDACAGCGAADSHHH